jgi:CubicO group peptidase (beta-lactamase class C family)
MMRIPYRIVVVAAGLCAALVSSAQYNGKVTFDFSLLQNRIQGWVDSGYYKGCAIVIARKDTIVYKKYFGDHTPHSVAYVASAGKWLAAAAIAAVVDEGKLHWNDQVRKWLPDWNDQKGEATLQQLLSHTAGYPDYQPAGQQPDHYQTLQEAVAHIAPLAADTIPGTRFTYGGLAMQVAGRMAELATGKDWETLFREKIARPLHMDSTHFTPVDETPGHNPMLAGGARTSMDDYSNFLNMISHNGVFQGERILSVNAVRALQANAVQRARVSPGEYVANARADDRMDIYGLGEWREEVNTNGEATLISSPSWAGAYPWIDKENQLYGFFLARTTQARPFNAFYESPVLPLLVRDAIAETMHPEVKRGYVQVESGQLFYEELGKGEPLVFIHGHSFDLHEWDPQFYEFARQYRVIRYDVRGYGKSTMPVPFANTLHADDLAVLLDSLHISRAHIVGLSMGGFITTDFLALYQHRILSATLASGDLYGHDGPSVPWTTETIQQQLLRNQAYMAKGVLNSKKEWFNGLTMHNGQPVASLRKPVWNMIYKWNAWQQTHIEPRFLLGKDAIEKLKQTTITVPVLVLTGAYDAKNKRQINTFIPSAQTAIVPNAGHVSNLENVPGFNKAVFEFLRRK